MAAKCVQNKLKDMKNITICEPIVTIKTSMNADTIEKMQELAKMMANY